MLLAELFGFWNFFFLFIFLMFIGIGQAIKGAVDVTKKIVQSDEAKDVGRGFLAAWLDDHFGRK